MRPSNLPQTIRGGIIEYKKPIKKVLAEILFSFWSKLVPPNFSKEKLLRRAELRYWIEILKFVILEPDRIDKNKRVLLQLLSN